MQVEHFFGHEVWIWLKRPETTETYPDGRPVLRLVSGRVIAHDTAGAVALDGDRMTFYPWIHIDHMESKYPFRPSVEGVSE